MNLTLFYIMFWSWLDQWMPLPIPLRLVLAGLFLVRALQISCKQPIPLLVIWGFLYLGGLMVVNIFLCGIGPNIVKNIMQLGVGGSALLYFYCLMKNDEQYVINFLKRKRWVFNSYLIINLGIMVLQLGGTYFLMNPSTLTNTFYPDLIAGFFGPNGTHRLTLFFCMDLLLNLSFYGQTSRLDRRMTALYLGFAVLGYSAISTQNDNIAFFPVVLIFTLAFIARKRLLRPMTLVFTILIAAAALIIVGGPQKGQLNEAFSDRVSYIVSSYSATSSQTPENRLRILRVLLSDWNGFGAGSGLGNLAFYNDPRIDPLHYGMCSAQSLIGMGGILFYGSIVAINACCVTLAIRKDNRLLCFAESAILLLSTSYYTILFSQIYNLFPVFLMLLLIERNEPNYA